MTRRTQRAALKVERGGGADGGSVLITGGAGFVGTNLAHRLLSDGVPVTIFDNLSRPGVDRNLRWLRDTHGGGLRIEIGDVRDPAAVERVVRGAGRVAHFAAQVAVTTSITDPAHDFEVNARGTLNLLNAIASQADPPALLYTSTNKVYGGLEDVALEADALRYHPADPDTRARGIGEARPLDFRSPYGCSKGTADQYVLDYARTFGLRSFVFRMSCIYGPHQFGTEDQGWVAHFLIRAIAGEPITVYGDGRQVRDVLYIDDLTDAMLLAFDHAEAVAGRAFNIGGGPGNTTSLLELIEQIGEIRGAAPAVEFAPWRPADQRYYVSDTTLFSSLTGWQPRVGVGEGVRRLHDWLVEENQRAPATARRKWRAARAAGASATVGD